MRGGVQANRFKKKGGAVITFQRMNSSVLNQTRVGISQDQVSPFAVAEDAPTWTIEAIQIRAEAVSPVMEEILQSRPPTHWGINE